MELFKNLNVRKKMIVSFALVIALMSAMAGFAIIQMNIVSATLSIQSNILLKPKYNCLIL